MEIVRGHRCEGPCQGQKEQFPIHGLHPGLGDVLQILSHHPPNLCTIVLIERFLESGHQPSALIHRLGLRSCDHRCFSFTKPDDVYPPPRCSYLDSTAYREAERIAPTM